jgi:hypothetical protein
MKQQSSPSPAMGGVFAQSDQQWSIAVQRFRRARRLRGHAMTSDDEIRQPQTVSKNLANYLEMTTPRSRTPQQRPPRRREHDRTPPPAIDNRGLSLEEGNDFA